MRGGGKGGDKESRGATINHDARKRARLPAFASAARP